MNDKTTSLGELMEEDDAVRKQMSAIEFLGSARGRLVMSKALYLAIKTLNKTKGAKREISTIADMQFMMDNLFPAYQLVASIDEEVTRKRIKRENEKKENDNE